MLTQAQKDEYDRVGAIVVPDVLSPAEVAELRAVTDGFVERARAITTHDAIYDLEDSHRRRSPASAGSRRRTCTTRPMRRWCGTRRSSPCCRTFGGRTSASTPRS